MKSLAIFLITTLLLTPGLLADEKADSDLLKAASRGSLRSFKKALKKGANINTKNDEGMNSLHLAARKSRKSILTHLLKEAVEANAIDNQGNNVIHYLVTSRYHKYIPDFAQKGASVNLANQEGLSPLGIAIAKNKSGAITSLGKAGADMAKPIEGKHPLWFGHDKKRWGIVAALLKGGADANVRNAEHKTLLIRAIEINSSWLAGKVLDAKADFTAQNAEGETPLTLAIKKNRVKIAKMLLKAGASINQSNRQQEDPAVLMIDNSRTGLLKDFIKAGLSLSQPLKTNELPLRRAHDQFMKKFNKARSALFVAMVKAGANVNIKNSINEYILFDYINKKVAYYIKVLAKAGAKMNVPDSEGNYPIHVAANTGKYDVVKAVLAAGASIGARDKADNTALLIAVKRQNTSMVKLLISKGARVNATNNARETPLILATQKQNLGMVKLLLSKGAKASSKNLYGNTLLIELAKADPFSKNKNTIKLLQLLMKYRINVNARNKYGNTALMYAVNRKNNEVIDALLKGGAKVDLADERGNTALHKVALAALYQNLKNQDLLDMLYLFRKHGADFDKKNNNGKTVLIMAAEKGIGKDKTAAAQIAQTLLDLGIDANVRDNSGRSADDYARSNTSELERILSLSQGRLTQRNGFDRVFINTSDDDQVTDAKIGATGNLYIAIQRKEKNFIEKYDDDGERQWSFESGGAFGIALDMQENIYIQGVTLGAFAKNGKPDRRCKKGQNKVIYLKKISNDRQEVFTEYFGKSRACNATRPMGIVADSGGNPYMGIDYGKKNKYVFGYNQEGKQKWRTRWRDDWSTLGISNQDMLLLHGSTMHMLASNKKGYRKNYLKGGSDSFTNVDNEGNFISARSLKKGFEISFFSSRRQLLWRRMFASNKSDLVDYLVADNEGNIYLGGRTRGSLHGFSNQGSFDCFVLKIDNQGRRQWTKQFGSTGDDQVMKMVADRDGIIVLGFNENSIFSQPHGGKKDAFLIKFDREGNLLN